MSSYYDDFHQECEIAAWSKVEGTNPYGKITDGLLRITGKVASLTSDLKLPTEGYASFRRSLKPWNLEPSNGHTWRYHLDWSPSKDSEPCGKLKMVLMGSATRGHETHRSFFGLLVHETESEAPGTFYRVGVFESYPKGQAMVIGSEVLHWKVQTVDIK
jgi:hypothetical protein